MKLQLFDPHGNQVHERLAPANVIEENPIIVWDGKYYTYTDAQGSDWIAYSETEVVNLNAASRVTGAEAAASIYGRDIG